MILLYDAHIHIIAHLLPSLTLLSHTLFLLLAFSIPVSARAASPVGNSMIGYVGWNIVAVGASMVGIIGAMRTSPTLLSLFALIHTTTLTFLTLSLTTLFLPTSLSAFIPFLPRLRFDPSTICGDLESEGEWLGKCEGELFIIKAMTSLVVGMLLAAQWWAVVNIWWWARGLERRERRGYGDGDVESLGGEEKIWKGTEEKSRV